MQYIIRKSTRGDIKDISHIVTICWNDAYKGIVPDSFLEELKNNEEERIEKSCKKFDENNNNQLVLEVDGKVVGFSCYGINDEGCGELFALYIYKEYQGYGYGKKLVLEVAKQLNELGYNDMMISCLKGNPSNNFYKHIGGKYIKDRVYKKLNLPENVYLYKDIKNNLLGGINAKSFN